MLRNTDTPSITAKPKNHVLKLKIEITDNRICSPEDAKNFNMDIKKLADTYRSNFSIMKSFDGTRLLKVKQKTIKTSDIYGLISTSDPKSFRHIISTYINSHKTENRTFKTTIHKL